jgi:hypothetical protein
LCLFLWKIHNIFLPAILSNDFIPFLYASIRAEEHLGLVSSSLDADLPTFEALSLSGPPLLTPQTTDDDKTDTDEAYVSFAYPLPLLMFVI